MESIYYIINKISKEEIKNKHVIYIKRQCKDPDCPFVNYTYTNFYFYYFNSWYVTERNGTIVFFLFCIIN